MKKILLPFAAILSLGIFLYPAISNSNNGGSPGGKSGSPSDNANCTSCHNAAIQNGASITSNIPANGYTPGQTYTITATVSQSGINKFGFELTAEEANSASAKTGTFFITNSSETKSVNSNTAVSHKSGGTTATNNSRIWTMDWQAPSSGNTDGITFYGSFLGANGNNNDNGDTYHAATLTVNKATVNALENLRKNNSFTYNANNNTIQANMLISIYDINGKQVLSSQQSSINLSALEQGIYIVKSIHKTEKIFID